MKRRYALYALAAAPLVFLLATTSYGVLLLASIVAIVVLSMSIIAWIAVFSASERIAHVAVRIWKTVMPAQVQSLLSRQ